MFEKLKSLVKGGLMKMGLMKKLKDISEIKSIPLSDATYKEIEKWQMIYSGYFNEWHDVFYNTIESGRKKRRMNSLKMAKVVSEEMASLIFNEKCQFNIS